MTSPSLPAPAATSLRDTTDVRDAVRDAHERALPLRVVAGGSWLDAGRPCAATTPLDLSALRGIIEYVPGDLTLTARAATPLAEIDALTRANGQWLTLDPFGDARATLGATLATASAGALAGALGLPRDVALGVEFVTGEGMVVRGGGRVVKNVAGFDLVRLTVGAWGTLGVVTEVTVRLRALPEHDQTIALPVAATHGAPGLHAVLALLRDPGVAPIASELLSAPLAARLSLGDREVLLVRLAGNEESVAAQRRALASVGDVLEVPGDAWGRLRAIEPADAASFRLSSRPSRLPTLWRDVVDGCTALDGALVHASASRGVVRVIAPHVQDAALTRVIATLGTAGSLIAERLPAASWQLLPPAFDDALAVSTRRAFDPKGILNPGIVSST